MNLNRKTKIVATIGPASERPEVLTELIKEGMNVARLNFSHGDHAEHMARVNNIRKLSAKLKSPVAIIGDLQGPKIRIGSVPKEGIPFVEGSTVVFDASAKTYDGKNVPLPSKIFKDGTTKGDVVMFDDGVLSAEVVKVDGSLFTMKVIRGGTLFSNKGVNVPDLKLSRSVLEKKDKEDIVFAKEAGVDYVAMSFLRTGKDVLEVKSFLKGTDIKVISKIERPEALVNIDEIIKESDAIMVARGDLGVETPIWALPVRQKEIVDKARMAMKPVIVATQMLDSMIRNPMPTRAEVSDVANAVYDSADAVMLSGESANGKYPIEAVRMMRKILEETEKHSPIFSKKLHIELPVTLSVAKAAKFMAIDLSAKIILAGTAGGYTARAVSHFRPKVPIVALTSIERVANLLALVWGVVPLFVKGVKSVDDLPGVAKKVLKEYIEFSSGDRIIFVSGLKMGAVGQTNNLSVMEI